MMRAPLLCSVAIVFHSALAHAREISFQPWKAWGYDLEASPRLLTSNPDETRLVARASTFSIQSSEIEGVEVPRSQPSGGKTRRESRDAPTGASVFVGPDVTDRLTLLNLAKATWDAYHPTPSHGDWTDVEGHSWKAPFGWDTNGLRGHFFLSDDGEHGLIAFKGTSFILSTDFPISPSAIRDRLNDNRLFSCCCSVVDWGWKFNLPCQCKSTGKRCCASCVQDSLTDRSASYYVAAQDVVEYFQAQHPNTSIWLTGHSLGGAIASLMGLKYNLPTVAFEAPGERLAAVRLGLTTEFNATHVKHITHVYNDLDRLALGTCIACAQLSYAMESKCHVGQTVVYSPRFPKWKPDALLFGHLLGEVVEILENALTPVPVPSPQLNCRDCTSWTFGDFPVVPPTPLPRHFADIFNKIMGALISLWSQVMGRSSQWVKVARY